MPIKTRSNAAIAINDRALTDPRSDEEILLALDALVTRATEGDGRAVGAIAIAFSPMLLAEARAALGPKLEQEDADVLQTFFLQLMEGQLRLPPIRGGSRAWMVRMVRLIATRLRAARESEWDPAG